MDVTTERRDSVLSARVGGRIDGANAYEFEETIRGVIEESDRAVIMDFEKLSYISSRGPSGRSHNRQGASEAGRRIRPLLALGSDPRDLHSQRFRQDHRDLPDPGRGPRVPRRVKAGLCPQRPAISCGMRLL